MASGADQINPDKFFRRNWLSFAQADEGWQAGKVFDGLNVTRAYADFFREFFLG